MTDEGVTPAGAAAQEPTGGASDETGGASELDAAGTAEPNAANADTGAPGVVQAAEPEATNALVAVDAAEPEAAAVAAAVAVEPDTDGAELESAGSEERDSAHALGAFDALSAESVDVQPAVIAEPEAPHPARRPRRWLRGLAISAVAVALAGLTLVALHATGSVRAMHDALIVMGFDPDRSTLIAALVTAAIAAAVVSVTGAAALLAVLVAIGAGAAVFWEVLRVETRSALDASGAQGVFDPLGWTVSIATLVASAAIAGWAAAMLVGIVRRFVIGTFGGLRTAFRERRRRVRGLLRLVAMVAAVAFLAVGLPVFSDMVNYAPDAHMRSGGTPGVGLVGDGTGDGTSTGSPGSSGQPGPGGPSGSPGSSGSPGGGALSAALAGLPAGLVAGPMADSLMTPNSIASGTPWKSWTSGGVGSLTAISLPGPWTGGTSATASFDVYMPPGYGNPGASTRYPVVYEAPYSVDAWRRSVGIVSMLDNLIDSGAIPPMIVVFISEAGGPFPDAECADSKDGREQMETFITTQVVPYIDAHFRTIDNPTARAVMGVSQGGYCSAALWSHHPDIFGSSLVFSGYFEAGIQSGTTINAGLPFGRDPNYESSQSPINRVSTMTSQQRSRSFVILSADVPSKFYGAQLRNFASILDANKVPFAVVQAPDGHSWLTVRDQLPDMLRMLALRMAHLGVFEAAGTASPTPTGSVVPSPTATTTSSPVPSSSASPTAVPTTRPSPGIRPKPTPRPTKRLRR